MSQPQTEERSALGGTSVKSHGADVLRGIAIVMVITFHAFCPIYGYFLPWNGWIRDFASPPSQPFIWFYPVTFGWAGVSLFFVLSGFCIHLSFLRNQSFDLKHFFWRRFWRIYPAYLLAVVVFAVLSKIDIRSDLGAKQIWSHVLLIHNFSGDTFFGINASFWSIATEIQLYVLFPVLLVIRSRIGITGCLVATFAVGMVWRIFAVLRWGLPDHLIDPALSSPFMTWFDWTLGAFVAERFFSGTPAFRRRKLMLWVLIPSFLVTTCILPLTTFSFSVAAAISAVILDISLEVNWRKNLAVTGLMFIGFVSYSLYLWHQPRLFDAVRRIEQVIGSTAMAWILLIPLLLAGAWVCFRFVEQTGIRVGDALWRRFCRSKSDASRIKTSLTP